MAGPVHPRPLVSVFPDCQTPGTNPVPRRSSVASVGFEPTFPYSTSVSEPESRRHSCEIGVQGEGRMFIAGKRLSIPYSHFGPHWSCLLRSAWATRTCPFGHLLCGSLPACHACADVCVLSPALVDRGLVCYPPIDFSAPQTCLFGASESVISVCAGKTFIDPAAPARYPFGRNSEPSGGSLWAYSLRSIAGANRVRCWLLHPPTCPSGRWHSAAHSGEFGSGARSRTSTCDL